MYMVFKRKTLTRSEEVKIIQEVEKNPTMLQNVIAECFVLSPLLLNNIILWKAAILEEESCCGHILRNKKLFFY
jgi:hypothetical protein